MFIAFFGERNLPLLLLLLLVS